jgi:uncharacterized protein YjbI with pentapeptide repeats
MFRSCLSLVASSCLPVRAGLLGGIAFLASVGCSAPIDAQNIGTPSDDSQECEGANLSGANLAGTNLAGTNLAGTNLAGANLGGNNLAGNNLAGTNLAGTNLAGNNLGGSNLAGSNLAGANLAGTNLAGTNLSGKNLAGSNLAGSNLAGTNLSGNNLAGTNLSGTNLAGTNSGSNIHALAGSMTGMLYSGEDLYKPTAANGTNSSQCVVMGIGSTAFSKLLGQQSTNAKLNVALGKLPWAFSNAAGGPKALDAWEAVVWGDKSYCVFVMAVPPSTAWSGVAGFIKAIFRWNAPMTQSMDISGIEASASVDSTLDKNITTYTGMMNAAAKWRAGTLTAKTHMAGETGFITATTNNQSVMVDFSAWAQDNNKNAMVLGNVQASSPPTYAESVYITLDNGDGTVQVIIDDGTMGLSAANMPAGITNSNNDLGNAYAAFQSGQTTLKPTPLRCAGALSLSQRFGEPVPAGKCDSGIIWPNHIANCIAGYDRWSTVSGTTAPMSGYMALTHPGGGYTRALSIGAGCAPAKTVLSETYVHMWETNYSLATCTPKTCASLGKNCGVVPNGCAGMLNCGSCSTGSSCGGGGTANVCSSANAYLSTGGTVSSSDPGTSPQDMTQAFDQDPTTKWLVKDNPTPSIIYNFSGTGANTVKLYYVGAGNDLPDRDPTAWVLEASNDGTNWTAVDSRSNQSFNRLELKSISISNTTAYQMYRLRITANNTSKDFQISELQLFGSAGGGSGGSGGSGGWGGSGGSWGH